MLLSRHFDIMTIWQGKSGRDVSLLCPCLSLPGYQEMGCLLYSSLFHYIFARTILSPTYHIIADLDYITCWSYQKGSKHASQGSWHWDILLFIKGQNSPCSIGRDIHWHETIVFYPGYIIKRIFYPLQTQQALGKLIYPHTMYVKPEPCKGRHHWHGSCKSNPTKPMIQNQLASIYLKKKSIGQVHVSENRPVGAYIGACMSSYINQQY